MSDSRDSSRNSNSISRSRSRSPCYRETRNRSLTHSKTRSRSLSRIPIWKDNRCNNRSRRSYSISSSTSRSYADDRRRNYRSHSQGSGSRRSIHENSKRNKCLGIFGLNPCTTKNQLYEIFEKYGYIDKILIVNDVKTGRSRGFGFVYFKKYENAKLAKEKCSGMIINDREVRLDFSVTQRPHTPTPGIYMGTHLMREERPSMRRGYDRSYNRYDREERNNRYDRDRDYDDYYESRYRGSGSGRGDREGGGGEKGDYYRERRSPSYYNNRLRCYRSRSRS